jgi:myosin heavy subunit
MADEWTEYMSPQGLPYYYNQINLELVWDKPDAMKTSAELQELSGEFCWIVDETEAFLPAKKVGSLGNGGFRVEVQNAVREVRNVEASGIGPDIPFLSALKTLRDDLVQMDVVNEPNVVHMLRSRFEVNKIYTWIGNILVAINPFQTLPLYTPPVSS